MRLSTRLALAMVTLVLLTVAAVGLLTYRSMETAILPGELDRVETHADALASELEAYVESARADVLTFRAATSVDGIVQASRAGGVDPRDGRPETYWRDRLAGRFTAELAAKPSYLKMRLIGAADGGREIVRVERAGDSAISRAGDDELQRDGERDYFTKTIGLAAGEVYVSPIDLNRERGAIAVPHVPVLRTATVVQAPDGKPFGIIVITVDLRRLLASIRAQARGGRQIFVVNADGDYLLHPDASREFGFELGRPHRWREEAPELAAALGGQDAGAAMVSERGDVVGAALATARPAEGPVVKIIETVPYAQLMAPAIPVRQSSLIAAGLAVACAVLLAGLVARTLTHPLTAMTQAVEGFAEGRPVAVPVDAKGEIGVLARAFARMVGEVEEKTAALKKETEQRRQIVESSLDLILVTDADGRILHASPSARDILGYRPGEMVGRVAADFIHPDDLDTARVAMRTARRGRAMRNFECRYLHKDGRTVTLTWSGVWSEPVQKHFFSGRDVTEQKLAEEKFRLAVDASPSGIIMIDGDGAIVLVNTEIERMFGYRRDELIGRPVDMLVPLGMRARHVVQRGAFMAAPGTRRLGAERDLRGLRKDGGEFPVEIGLNPIATPRGALVLGTVVDITARRKAREALEESERMARGIIDTALDAFVQWDETGTVIDWNPHAAALFGWSREEAIGRKAGELIVPERHRANYVEVLMQFMRSEDSARGRRFELEARRRDGQEIKVELSVAALRQGDRFVFNGFIRDLTEKLAAEEQRRQSQKMETIGQLTGGIAHDFNNILTVITGTIEILEEGVAADPGLAAIAKMIDEAAARGAELTQRLLAFARRQPLQPRTIDVNTLIIDTAKLLRPTLGEHIEIDSVLEDDAWPAMVDPGQLTTALINLAINARDAMPEGGKLMLETGNVELDEGYARTQHEVAPGPYVMIAVSDSGHGIPAAIRERVFDPFFTTKGAGKGTGLGLSMVYGFVKQSNGHIKIYSEEGHGTTIKLYLPRSNEQAVAVEARPTAAIEGGRERILVVEDDPLVRHYVAAQLASLGYTTLTAVNATEALARIDDGEAFDLLFTDVIMPGPMNGRQLADAAAQRRPGLKVLFTSGYTEDAIVHHGRLDPGVLLLGKPYRKADLARMVRAALGSPAQAADGDATRRGPATEHAA
jgi:PAS domain S-box-containing protein